ncbi:MAG: hypothetical protein A4E19_20585 [Nitrospira sp. SG-bin1]|nr:MAG: hypothetical protein A4E19_20585 [Nitrospira sp. SG-bin1]
MDQRASIVEQDIKDILETRLEIGRKIQLLDEKARYEWENAKSTWSGLTSNMGETGKELIDRSARVLNPVRQMNVRPWAALGGMVLFGYVVGMLGKNYRRQKVYPYYPPQARGASVMPSEEKKEARETEPGVYPYFPGPHREAGKDRSNFVSDLWGDVKGNVQTELQRSKEAIVYALREFTRDMAKEIVPTILKSMTSHPRGSRR